MVKRVMNEIDTDKNCTIELEEFYDFFDKIDDMIRNGFGQEVKAATESAGGNQGAVTTSQESSGVSQEAFNDLLAKVTAQNEAMAKMQSEFKAGIQALQDEHSK